MNDAKVMELQNVGVFYSKAGNLFTIGKEKFWAVKDVSFDLRKGETLGLIGRNGAGKSTLLMMMAGILRPDRGKILYRPSKIALLSLQIGFVPDLSGFDNILLSGLLSGYTRNEIKAKMGDIIEFSGLEKYINDPIHSYSTGMKARLGFSIAFFTDPDILLVDETLGVGDESFQRKSTEKMKERIKSNKTVVLVSHSQSVISELCDRVVWIEDGRTIMQGPTESILQEYSNSMKRPRIR